MSLTASRRSPAAMTSSSALLGPLNRSVEHHHVADFERSIIQERVRAGLCGQPISSAVSFRNESAQASPHRGGAPLGRGE
jgi:hypothetical protein